MKNFFKKSVALLSTAAIVLSTAAGMSASTSSAAKYSFTGQTSNTTQNLTVNGVDTGADWTQIKIGANSGIATSVAHRINIVEANLSNTNLTFEVLNHRSGGTNYIKNASTLSTAVGEYNEGGKIIAAVNGDWMHFVDTTMKITNATAHYRVSTSALVLDGEIWCSQITQKEPVQGVPYDGPYSFGVTKDNQPVIGQLQVNVVLKNTSSNVTVQTDGLNRAPANNTIVVYNDRLNSSNGVPTDAYELLIKTNGTNKFMQGAAVTGTVEKIYPSGTTTRSELKDGYVIVMARGNRLSEISGKFPVGSSVSITTSMNDAWGRNNDLWAKCEEVIGGHILIMKDGKLFDQSLNTNTSNYPTNIIGYKDDGTVVMAMVTADVSGKYVGLKFSQINQFCQDIGFNTCFMFDGGGSTTMVTLEGGSYVSRAMSSDGSSQRSVWNSLALVYGKPTCSKQGSMNHIFEAQKFNPYNVTFDASIATAFSTNIATAVSTENNVLTLKATSAHGDAQTTWDFSSSNASSTVNASTYKYIVIRYKASVSGSGGAFKFYLCPGSIKEATEQCSKDFALQKDNQWHTVIVDLSSIGTWSGNLNKIRLDYIDGDCKAGDTVQISNFGFAKNASEATTLANSFGNYSSTGTAPSNSPAATATAVVTATPEATADTEVTPEPDETDVANTADPGSDTNTSNPTATDAAGEDDNDENDENNGENNNSDEKKGCKSVISVGAVALVPAMLAAVLVLRKRD